MHVAASKGRNLSLHFKHPSLDSGHWKFTWQPSSQCNTWHHISHSPLPIRLAPRSPRLPSLRMPRHGADLVLPRTAALEIHSGSGIQGSLVRATTEKF